MNCLPQYDFRPAETHRDPSGDQLQHKLAGVTTLGRQVIGKLDADTPLFCHHPHLKWRRTCRKAVPEHRQPVSLGEVEEHCRITARGDDRRVGESGLSRCSSRYCCPIMHCTRSFRYRIKLFHCRNRPRAAQKPAARTDVRLLGNSCSSRTRSESAGRLPRISPYRIGTSRRDVCAVSGSRRLPILGSHSLEGLLSVVQNVRNGSMH